MGLFNTDSDFAAHLLSLEMVRFHECIPAFPISAQKHCFGYRLRSHPGLGELHCLDLPAFSLVWQNQARKENYCEISIEYL